MTASREYTFTARHFARVRQLIFDAAGISLADSKADMAYSRLARRMRKAGVPDFDAYLQRVTDDVGGERQAFVNALTTNLTSFFREAHHFDQLAEVLETCASRPVRIWCAAASTGEEPYSIAMTAVEHFGSPRPPVQIVATDIDTDVLVHARAGIYDAERIAELSAARHKQFFLRGTGPNAGRVRIKPALASLVDFAAFNLLAGDWRGLRDFDVVFCRNVMIYFDGPTQEAILGRIAATMRPGGCLFVGHSENYSRQSHPFKASGRTVYRLPASSADPSADTRAA